MPSSILFTFRKRVNFVVLLLTLSLTTLWALL